jgi:hypothetical protein
MAQFALDLRPNAPSAVRDWLDAPIVTRGLSDRGPESFMDGGSAAEWFDLVVHRQGLTPVQQAAGQRAVTQRVAIAPSTNECRSTAYVTGDLAGDASPAAVYAVLCPSR